MRKFAFVAALVLVSATAQAGQSRTLITTPAEQPSAEPPKETPKETLKETLKVQTAQTLEAATPAPAETPKFVERPAAVDTTAPPLQPKADAVKDSARPAPQTGRTAKADKPKHRRYWSEARIIGELHRHGIYW